jgi:hypothetical protein
VLATLSNHGIHEAFIHKCAINTLTCHKLDEILKGTLKSSTVESPYILYDFFAFIL